MNKNLLLAISALTIALTGCNDKAAEYQQSVPEAPAIEASATPAASAAQLAEYKGDLNALGKVDLCALDAINGKAASEGSFKVPSNNPIALEGWAATTSLTNPQSVVIVLSGADKAFAISGPAGIARDDVAKAYKAAALTNSGFKLELTELHVPAGEYAVAVLHDEAGTQVSCASPLKVVIR